MNDGKEQSRDHKGAVQPNSPADRREGAVFPRPIMHRQCRLPTRAAPLLRGQYRRLARAAVLPLLAAISLAAPGLLAQALPIAGSATDFNSVEYYGPPHQLEIKRLFSGAEAEPIAGGLLLVKKVKLEMFDLNGKLQLVAQAPECIYDPVNVVASSPGAVHVRTGDGRFTIDGEGFLWRQNESVFTISNQVQTVIDRMPALKR